MVFYISKLGHGLLYHCKSNKKDNNQASGTKPQGQKLIRNKKWNLIDEQTQ